MLAPAGIGSGASWRRKLEVRHLLRLTDGAEVTSLKTTYNTTIN